MSRPLTDEEVAERIARANKATRGALAAVLCLEGFVVLLVPRAIAQTSTGLDGIKTGVLLGLAAVLVAIAFLLKRPWGIAVGTLAQVPFILTGVWAYALFAITGLFACLWCYLLWLRRDLMRRPRTIRELLR